MSHVDVLILVTTLVVGVMGVVMTIGAAADSITKAIYDHKPPVDYSKAGMMYAWDRLYFWYFDGVEVFIYVSSDGGQTWTPLVQGLRMMR